MYRTFNHKFTHYIVKPFARPIFYHKNHFTSKVYKLDKKKNYIILSNHQTTWDPFLVGCAFKNIVYPISSKDFIPHKLRWLVYTYCGPILKAKTLKDLGAVKKMLSVIKEGNNILLYPEGNRTFSGDLCYISKATVKFLQKAKADIVFYNLHGGYGADPRYSKEPRKGKFYGEVRKIITHEEAEAMSQDELYQAVIENLTVKEAPADYEYESDSRAEYLERTLYRCPCCGKISTIRSKGNFVSCSSCGLEAEYLPNLTFRANKPEFKHLTVASWFHEQEDWIRNYTWKENEVIFTDENALLHLVHEDTDDVLITSGKLSLTDNEMTVGEKTFSFSEIREMTVNGKQTLLFYVGTDTYRISAEWIGLNCVKYMQMYYHITQKKMNMPDDFLGI